MTESEFIKSNTKVYHPCYLCMERIIDDNKYCGYYPKYNPYCIMLLTSSSSMMGSIFDNLKDTKHT